MPSTSVRSPTASSRRGAARAHRARRRRHLPRARGSWSATRWSTSARATVTCTASCGSWSRGVIRTLAALGVMRRAPWPGRTGVWVADEGADVAQMSEHEMQLGRIRKIASIGIAVRGGITMHGFALNVAMDLTPFAAIVPCGLAGVRMTTVARETAIATRALPEVAAQAARHVGAALAWPYGATGAHRGSARMSAPATARRHPDWTSRSRAGRRGLRAHPGNRQGIRRRDGVRGALPERRRVLGARYRDLHAHGRHLHAQLRLLRGEPDGRPEALDPMEPIPTRARGREARSAARGGDLSVDRDDLLDLGAGAFRRDGARDPAHRAGVQESRS